MNSNNYYSHGGNPSGPILAVIGASVVVVIIVVIALSVRKSKRASAPSPAPVPAPEQAPVPAPAQAPMPAPIAPPIPEEQAPIVTDRQISGCEADPAILKCSSGVIKGGNIRYGRWNNSVCPHPTVNANTAFREKTYSMYAGCLNKPECTLAGGSYNQNLKEDIYPNVYKQWEIKYQCQQ